MKLNYKNTEITVSATGDFSASVAGNHLSASSLKALKKKIDATTPFTPFDGFIVGFYDDKIERFKVVGFRQRRGRSNYHEWICEYEPGRTRTHAHIHRATPEALRRAKAYVKLMEDNKRKREKMDEEESVAKTMIGEVVSPDTV